MSSVFSQDSGSEVNQGEAMHEGQRLVEVLAQHRRTQADLAEKLGYSPGAVNKYTKMPTFSPSAWASVKQGLEALDIKPSLVRVEQAPPRQRKLEDLRPHLKGFTRQH